MAPWSPAATGHLSWLSLTSGRPVLASGSHKQLLPISGRGLQSCCHRDGGFHPSCYPEQQSVASSLSQSTQSRPHLPQSHRPYHKDYSLLHTSLRDDSLPQNSLRDDFAVTDMILEMIHCLKNTSWMIHCHQQGLRDSPLPPLYSGDTHYIRFYGFSPASSVNSPH